ncbi:hypothetical protein C4609_10915, partial [Streptococcus agalactiae]
SCANAPAPGRQDTCGAGGPRTRGQHRQGHPWSQRRRTRPLDGDAGVRTSRPGQPGANASASAGRPGTCRGDVLPAAAAASARGAGGRGSGACLRRGRWVDSDFRGRWALWRLSWDKMGGGWIGARP